MLKIKLTKEEYEALSDEMKAAYKANGNNTGYVLDTDEARELKAAKDREKTRADEAERKLQELVEEQRTNADKRARESGDVAALEKSWSDKYEALKAEHETAIAKMKEDGEKLSADLRAAIDTLTVDRDATTVAAEISTAPKLMLPHLRGRLRAEIGADGAVVTRVLDKSGKPSAMTLDDLKKEFRDNADFSAIIKAGHGSGAGSAAPGNSRTPGSAPLPKSIVEMTPAEAKAVIAAKRAETQQ